MNRALLAALAALGALAPVLAGPSGCEDAPPAADSCATAGNGACEEPSACALGTDSADCDAACAADGGEDAHVAACAHDRAAEPPPEVDPALGTGGSGGVVGTWDGTVTVRGERSSDEVDRHFRVYAPRRYDARVPTPVVFVLGGFGVDMYWLAEYTEMDRAADMNGFLVVYGQPEWRDFGSYWVYSWYVYQDEFTGGWDDHPDVAYLGAVLDEVSSLYNVDRTRVYATGHSRGAALSLIAAFEMPDRVAGACAQAGFVAVNDYDDRMRELAPQRRFPVYLVHGTEDPDVPVSNSDGIAELLEELGWVEGETLTYKRLEHVGHEWQTQYDQQLWDFLSEQPLPAAPGERG